MNEQETWKPISGFEGHYEVSDKGRIYSYNYNKILNGGKNTHGYYNVMLHKNGQYFNKRIHRLVAEAFLLNPQGLPEVNHKNEIKTDNRVENLEFVSHQYNSQYSLSNYWVFYDPGDNRVEIYNLEKFARDYNLCSASLYKVAIGKRNSYKGYTAKPNVKYTRQQMAFRLVSPDGHTVTFQSQTEAGDYIGAYQQDISNLLKGKRKSVKGWTLPE